MASEGGPSVKREPNALLPLGSSREVQEIYAREDDEETAEQGDGVDCGCSVEALEEEARSDEGTGREHDVVEGVDTESKS